MISIHVAFAAMGVKNPCFRFCPPWQWHATHPLESLRYWGYRSQWKRLPAST